MTVEVHFNIGAIESMLSGAAMTAARMKLCEQVKEDCNKYVPVRTGALQGSANVMSGGEGVEWTVEYGGYVYNMDHVISAGNPNGRPHWCEYAKQAHIKEWEDYLMEALK